MCAFVAGTPRVRARRGVGFRYELGDRVCDSLPQHAAPPQDLHLSNYGWAFRCAVTAPLAHMLKPATLTTRLLASASDVRDGLSVVDVVLVNDRDDELTIMATASFTVAPAGAPPCVCRMYVAISLVFSCCACAF